jgi:hypothetical protein
VGQAALNTAKQIGQAAFELGKLGAQFEGQQTGLNNLAGSFGQAGSDIQKAIQLGVAQTPAQFAELTNSALVLGRTLGLDATQSINQFTTALGRRSLLILDNFGISAKQVNAEIERLAQADFNKARSQLTEAQKQATFLKAALNIAGEAAATIGDEAGEAQAAFDRMTASATDLKTQLGVAISDLNQATGFTDAIARGLDRLTESIKIDIGFAEGAELDEQIEATQLKINQLQKDIETFQGRQQETGFLAFLGPSTETLNKAISDARREIFDLEISLEGLDLQKAAEDQKKFGDATDDTTDAIETSAEAIKAYESALKQAQSLQLSFAREGEDAARKLARANEDLALKQQRANEDIARKQQQSIAKLEKRQKKDRDKLLADQIKQLDKFDTDSRKQIVKAEADIRKARKEAGEQRKRDERKLQDDLQRERDKFNLSRLQSERRFNLQESRLRAEGDIIGLKELREDFALTQQEEKENFDFSEKEQVKSGKEQLKEQDRASKGKINDLKSNLETQRAELLASFDEQLKDQQAAQLEAIAEQRIGFEEAATERAIALQRQEDDRVKALAREEEDRRISQRRQLEDLGIALAEQKDITAQGVNAIAEEMERVFGIEGAANNIISGFSERTRSEFEDLFEDVENIIKEAETIPKKDIPLVTLTGGGTSGGSFGQRRGTTAGIPAFQDGGVVDGPGPIGSPQIIQAHKGETVLPTHQQSFTMATPVIPSQNLNVNMSGGFNITGDGQADEAILQAATQDMVENFRIAVARLARRN